MKKIFCILFLIIPFVAFGQSNEWDNVYDTIMISHKEYTDEKSFFVTDTILSQPFSGVNYLVGTAVLRTSNLFFAEYYYGLDFYKVENAKDCDFDYDSINELLGIRYIDISDTLLIIKFNYTKQWMQDILCHIDIIDDKILDLKFIEYGLFGETFSFNTLTCFIKINKKNAEKDFSDIKYVMLNGDKETLRKLENFSK